MMTGHLKHITAGAKLLFIKSLIPIGSDSRSAYFSHGIYSVVAVSQTLLCLITSKCFARRPDGLFFWLGYGIGFGVWLKHYSRVREETGDIAETADMNSIHLHDDSAPLETYQPRLYSVLKLISQAQTKEMQPW